MRRGFGFVGLDGTSSTALPTPDTDRLRDRAVAGRHPDDPGGAARHPARRRQDDPQPRPVGHRQAAQRQDAQRRRAANSTDLGSTGTGGVRGRRSGLRRRRGRRRRSRPRARSIDPGAYSEIRILGIPGNQTTGQQRVPVIITSLRDDTVGTTVRGVQMDDIFNSLPDSAVQHGDRPAPDEPDHARARATAATSTSAATR